MTIAYLNFDGSDDILRDATAPAAASVLDTETATFAAWVRQRAVASTFDRIFSTRNATSGINFSVSGDNSRKPWMQVDDGPNAVFDNFDSLLTQDVWHHLALTIDHGDGVDEAKMYLDGSAIGSTIDISAATGDYDAEHLVLGAETASGGFLTADLTYFEFYKDLATAAEISTAAAGVVGTGILGLSGAVSVVDVAAMIPLGSTYTDPQSNVYTVSGGVSILVEGAHAHSRTATIGQVLLTG